MHHLVSEFQMMLLLLTAVKIVNRARSAPGWRSRGEDGSEDGLAGVFQSLEKNIRPLVSNSDLTNMH